MTAPTINWDYLATLDPSSAAYERAMDALTGVRCDPDMFGMTTGDQHSREGRVEWPTAPESLPDGPVTPGVRTMRDAVAEALHAVRTDCPDVTTALVLTAAMHADVVSASGRIVATRLASVLGLPDDARGAKDARDALALALYPVVDRLASMLDDDDRPATRVTVPDVAAGRVVRSRVLTTDNGGSRERDGLRTATTSRERHALKVAQDEARPSMHCTRVTAPVLDQNGYPYTLGYQPCERVYGPVGPAPLAPRAYAFPWFGNVAGRIATALTHGTGDGHGTDAYGNRTRDAAGRVSLASGYSVARERLASPIIGGSYVLAAPDGTGARKARAPRPVAPAVKARGALDALRARMVSA